MTSTRRAALVLAGVSCLGVLSALPLAGPARAADPPIRLRLGGQGPGMGQPGAQIIIRGGVIQGPVPAPPGANPDGQAEGEFSDALSLTLNRKAKKSIEAAEDYIKDGSWGEAAHVLQSLLDIPEDSFIKVKRTLPDGQEAVHWTSVRAEASRLLGTLPPNGREVYELQFGARARERLKEARDGADPQLLAEVAQRFLHTKAGAEAAELLGTYHLDRGRPVMAALCFERLLRERQPGQAPAVTLLKAVLAFRRCGDRDNAERAWAQLSRGHAGGVRLGDRVVPLAALRQELERFQNEIISAAHDWPVFKGDPSRTSRGKGDIPFLEEDSNRWSLELAREGTTREWLRLAIGDQENRSQEAVLPALFPIASGGKLVFRDYRGVRAVDPRTGETVWEQPSRLSLDTIASGRGPQGAGASSPAATQQAHLDSWIKAYVQGNTQGVLFENSVLGTLSTDNQYVFVVDDLAVPPHPQTLQVNPWGRQQGIAFGAFEPSTHFNQLQAIDLETGKLKWQAGGRGDGELDDTFFLGPPLPLGGKLYVLTEKRSALRLVCLETDPAANQPVVSWTQTLAAVRDPLPRDVGRRLHAASLAYGDGMLVCPTNAGALLGVDLLTHSLVWAHSYREASTTPTMPPNVNRRPGVRFSYYMPRQALVPDWKDTAPVIQDGKVVFTAPDGASVHCLNLRDGTLVWKAKRAQDLYLAGVYHGKVLLVGKQACRALRLEDGRQVWATETGLPSGHGVATDKVFYLPLKNTTRGKEPVVCALDLDTGRILAQSRSRDPKDVPGNLLFYEGKVISQTALAVTAYPQLEAKVAELDRRLRDNPNDPAGLAVRGELKLDQGDLAGAVTDLHTALARVSDEKLKAKVHGKLFDALTELLQRDFDKGEKYLDEYRHMCTVPVAASAPAEERQQAEAEQLRRQANSLCLVARGRERQGRLVDAFRSYVEFGALVRSMELITVLDDQSARARPDVWAQGRILAMVNAAPEGQRRPLEEEVTRLAREAAGAKDLDVLRRFVTMFGALFRAGLEARLRLAERLLEEGRGPQDYLEAELHLLQVKDQDGGLLAGRAVELLARLMTRRGLLEDAAAWYRALGRDFADVVVRDGKTGKDLLDDLASDKRFLPFLDEVKRWRTTGQVRAKETPGNFGTMQRLLTLEPAQEPPPFFRRHDVTLNLQSSQLALLDRAEERVAWSQAVNRGQGLLNPAYPSHARYIYHLAGHLAVVHVGTMVYALDPVGQRLLWEKNLVGTTPLASSHVIVDEDGGFQAMFPDGRMQKIGQVGPVQAGFVCVQTRDGLQALDPLSGTVLWTRGDVPSQSRVFGDGQYVYYVEVHTDGGTGAGRALRARDGLPVDAPDFAPLYARKLRLVGRCLLLSDADPAQKSRVLRLYDVHTGKDVWKQEFSPKAVVLAGDDPALLGVAEPDREGRLTVIDLAARREMLKASVDPKELDQARDVRLLADAGQFYVAVNGPAAAPAAPALGVLPNFIGLRTAPVNGPIYAFDRATGKQAWASEARDQLLVLDEFAASPVVLCTAQHFKAGNLQLRGQHPVHTTLAVDKFTGKVCYQNETAMSTQFHTLRVNPFNRRVELFSYNRKIEFFLEGGSDDRP